MFKNLSFNRVVLYLTCLLVMVSCICFLLYTWLSSIIQDWLAGFIILVLCMVTMYLVIRRILGHYMYRRIKLIYKMIRSSKVSMKNKSAAQQDDVDVLDRVEGEVSKWLREQQQEIDSLKELEEYRKNFLGNISHELKTPIFSIQGYIHTLLDGGLYDEQVNRRFLEKAAVNVDRLETIVEDLDVIAKLEDATLELEKQSFDIKELVLDVIANVEVQARQYSIDVKLKPGADKSFQVHADREYIRAVLVNLIINSIKYGRPGGHTKIGFYDLHDHILVEIADNGIGISEEHLKHLFDRFYRVDKSRSRSKGGSGLGLSIVKHILEVHQQTINVRSTLGKGTTMGFTLQKTSNGKLLESNDQR